MINWITKVKELDDVFKSRYADKFVNKHIYSPFDVFIGLINAYVIVDHQGKHEKKFSELDFISKLSTLPSKLIFRFRTYISQKKNTLLAHESLKKLQKVDFLFVVVEQTHLHQTMPVALQLMSKGKSVLFVTNKESLYTKVQDIGVPVFMIHKEVSSGVKTIDSILECPVESDFWQFQKIFNERQTALIKHVLSQSYSLYSQVLIHNYELLFETCTPSAVVVGYDITVEGRLAVLMAKSRSIPTFMIQHGVITDDSIHDYHLSDYHIVYGEVSRQILIEKGYDDLNVLVGGAPYLDAILVQNDGYANPLIQKHILKEETNYILIALSGPGFRTSYNHFEQIISSLAQLSESMLDYTFVVKLHRKDRIENYTPILEKFVRHRLIIIDNDDQKQFPSSIFEWLKGCQLLITGTSAVAMEAMLMNVPVLTIDYFNEYPHIDFIKAGATLHVTDPQQLVASVHLILDREYARPSASDVYVQHAFFKPDGHTASRCADLIVQKSNH